MAATSSSFTTAPTDKCLTIDQLYDWHKLYSPNFPAFVFADEGSRQHFITWSTLGHAIVTGVDLIRSQIPQINEGKYNANNPIVVGILSTAGTLVYTTLLYSHIKLSHPPFGRPILPFLISTRNSPAVVAHLLRVTNARYLWVSEGPMTALANEALGQMDPTSDIPSLLYFPSYDDLYDNEHTPILGEKSDEMSVNMDLPAIILHSSGSTAFPKPITLTHRVLREWAFEFDPNILRIQGDIMAVYSTPLFHAMGVLASAWPTITGHIRAVTSPYLPPTPMTSDIFMEQVVHSNSKIIFCVPSFVESWSTDERHVEVLKKAKVVLWGGGPLNRETGEALHKRDVNLVIVFGATEFGCPIIFPGKVFNSVSPINKEDMLMEFFAAKTLPEGFEWFQFAPNVTPVLEEQADEDGVYELILKESKLHHPSVFNIEIEGTRAYATNDILESHPTNPSVFRVRGRKDDQLMLSTGEKTNPGPLESIVMKNPHVHHALMFGRGRTSNGILIEPTSFEEAEKLGLEKFRSLIWPSVEDANEYAPAHSRVFKEMILVASRSKPFLYTAKHTPRRGAIIKEYDAEIDAIYKAVSESVQSNVPVPKGNNEEGGWTLEEARTYVRGVVRSIMKGGASLMQDDDDIFGFGCDSLQATYIRNTLIHALRQVTPASTVQKTPPNFVYQNPTIASLAAFTAQLSQPAHLSLNGNLDTETGRQKKLQHFVHKYTGHWPVHQPIQQLSDSSEGEIILLTGSTGGLGSQILAQLIVMPSVDRIYAFNRPSAKSSLERHQEAFRNRGNDISLLKSEKIVFVEGDTSAEGFLIDQTLFLEIRNSITVIIHNAWRVDFNLSLASFEPAIRGVRHMVDLALRSPHLTPPRVIFTSSIGIVKSWANVPPIKEEALTDLSLVNGSGYSESKWTSEMVLEAASRETALKPVIVRVGQLAGGLNGNWNVQEWFPALVRAGQVVGGLPDNEGLVSFLPLHVAATALIELRHSQHSFAHLVHPRPVPWSQIIGYIGKHLGLPVISYEEWLTRLENAPKATEEELRANPALHLLDFYRHSAPPTAASTRPEEAQLKTSEAVGLASYEIVRTVKSAPSLDVGQLPPLGLKDVDSWIEYWKSRGALDQ